MITYTEIQEVAEAMYKEIEGKIKDYKNKVTLSIPDDTNTNLDDVGYFMNSIKTIIEGTTYEYKDGTYKLPRYYDRLYDEMKEGYIIIEIKSEINVRPILKRELKIIADDNIYDKIIKRILDVLFEMFYIEIAKQNLNELNQDLKKICQSASVPYTFGFGFDPYNSSMILSINDNEVIFNATQKSALHLGSTFIYAKGGEFNNYLINNQIKTLIGQLQSCQTTVQLIKGKVELIEKMTGITTRARAVKLLRQTYHRQVKNFEIVKQPCIGYFNEEVMIDGEPVEIFALVKKEKDEKDGTKGKQEVILQPFDVKTNFVVDYDVLNHHYS